MLGEQDYQALAPETLAERLCAIEAVSGHVGPDPETWEVREVGDGNLNLVFIVGGPLGTVIVKQALPYVRMVGDSWPLPLKRAFFEYHALIRQAERDPGSVPQVYHFDETQALTVMEYLSPHLILRGKLIKGEKIDRLAETLGVFCARTAFRGSDLSLSAAQRKEDAALFLDNISLCAITEDLIFTDPYFDAEMNHHTKALDPVVNTIREDVVLKTEVQHMLVKFTAQAETMCHGDLHTGSIMCTGDDTKIIDPEFALYGPMGFDIGMLTANLLMAYFSQPAHRDDNGLGEYQAWILEVIEGLWATFRLEFLRLWDTERTGILYPASLFEDQGHSSANAAKGVLARTWQDAIGICGIEMHRRILSLAHNADFESIEDEAIRAPLEARNLLMGRELVKNRAALEDIPALLEMAQVFNKENVL